MRDYVLFLDSKVLAFLRKKKITVFLCRDTESITKTSFLLPLDQGHHPAAEVFSSPCGLMR